MKLAFEIVRRCSFNTFCVRLGRPFVRPGMPANGGRRSAVTTLELLDAMEESIARHRARVSTPGAAVSGALVTRTADTAASANGSKANVLPANPLPATAPVYVHPDALRARIEKAGVSTEEFAAIFGVNPVALRGWLEVGGQIPAWVQPALHLLEALGPAARRRIFHKTASQPPEPKPRILQPKRHPFSRIEDL